MLDEILRRQRRLLRLVALGYVLACVLAVLSVFAPGAGMLGFMFLVYSSPLGVLAWVVRRNGWQTVSARELLRLASTHGEPWAVLRAIDAELARDGAWFGERTTWRFWSLPRFALVTPSWLVQTDPVGVMLVRLDDILWVFRHSRQDIAAWGVHRVEHGYRVYDRPGSLETVSMATPADADEVLSAILRHRPEVLVGFCDPWRGMLAGGPKPLVEEVDRRRQEWEAANEEQRAAWRSEQLRQLDEDVQQLQYGEPDPLAAQMSGRPAAVSGRASPIAPVIAAPLAPPGGVLSVREMMESDRSHLNLILMLAVLNTVFFASMCGTGCVISPPSASVGEMIVLAMMPLLLIGGPWALLVWKRRFRPIVSALGRELDRNGPREEVLGRIDAELRDPKECWSSGHWSRGMQFLRSDLIAVTLHWLIQVRPGRCAVIHLPNLVWVHQEVVPRRLWLAGPQYQFHLGCRLRGGEVRNVLVASEVILNQLLEELLERRPALLTGWRGEYVDLLERGGDALATAYEEREKQFLALAAEEREAWLDRSCKDFAALILNAE